MDLPRVKHIALDTETSGLHVDDGAMLASVGIAWEGGSLGLPFDQGIRDKLITSQMSLFEGENEDPNLSVEDWARFLKWLKDKEVDYFNAKFDLAMLQVGTRLAGGADFMGGVAWDAMVAEHLLEPNEQMRLDATAKRYGGAGKSGQDEIKKWLKAHRLPAGRYDLAPWSLVEPYVKQDAMQTWLISDIQRRRFGNGDADIEQLGREERLMKALYRMEARGVDYDCERSLAAARKLEQEILALEKDLPFDGNRGITAAKGYFFGTLGLTPDRTTPEGAPSLDAEQLRAWELEGVPGARQWLAISQARRAISMYYRGYPEKVGADGRLRTQYRQCKVKSGRMSVERVNLQAMPTERKTIEGVPGVRELLRPKSGYALWSLDLSQAELRVAARYAGCTKMLTKLNSGVDLHADTARRDLKARSNHKDWKGQRGVAKRLNFAAIFQVGAETFQATVSKETGVVLELSECQRMIQAWRREYPEFTTAYGKGEREAKRGYVRLLPATDYEVVSWWNEHDDWNKGWSRKVQGSLAEFFKLWMIDIEEKWPGWMLLTVHDSVLLEVLEGEIGEGIVEEIREWGSALATKLFGIEMPIEVERWK